MGDANSSKILSTTHIAIVGTGPLSLLKAIFIAKKNPLAEITLIDSGSQTGGAWYSDYSQKGHLIECGCHIWSYSPVAYQFIEKDLEVKLVPMKPAPIFVGKNLSLPYSLKNTIDTYKIFLKHVVKFQFGKLKTTNKRPYIHYRIFGKKNKYPETGSPELISALTKKTESSSQIKILLNTRITHLEIGDHVKLFTDEKVLEFDKVYLTYVSHIQKVILPNTTVTASPRQVDYIHFLISSDKPLKKKMSYWRFMNDAVVHRITDISYQTNFEENLFLVGIKGDAFHSEKENNLLTHVKNLMKFYKLMDDNQKFDLVKTHIFPTYYMDSKVEKALVDFKDKVELLHTTDLMYGFHYLLDDEKSPT